jgi:uncharacterized protein
MTMVIIPAYAALFALIFTFLSARTIRLRRSQKVAVETGGNALLERAVRVHGNFAEYVPITLIILGFDEARLVPQVILHILCLALLTGRVLHAVGVAQPNENFKLRVIAMILTLNTLGAASIILLATYIF